jgi:hypothetical protein
MPIIFVVVLRMPTARRWDMNLTSALARVEFGSAVDMSNITAKIPQFCFSFSLQVLVKSIHVGFSSQGQII